MIDLSGRRKSPLVIHAVNNQIVGLKVLFYSTCSLDKLIGLDQVLIIFLLSIMVDSLFKVRCTASVGQARSTLYIRLTTLAASRLSDSNSLKTVASIV